MKVKYIVLAYLALGVGLLYADDPYYVTDASGTLKVQRVSKDDLTTQLGDAQNAAANLQDQIDQIQGQLADKQKQLQATLRVISLLSVAKSSATADADVSVIIPFEILP